MDIQKFRDISTFGLFIVRLGHVERSAPCHYTPELKLKMSYRSITQVAMIDAL
jgi:hypothetical protein